MCDSLLCGSLKPHSLKLTVINRSAFRVQRESSHEFNVFQCLAFLAEGSILWIPVVFFDHG